MSRQRLLVAALLSLLWIAGVASLVFFTTRDGGVPSANPSGTYESGQTTQVTLWVDGWSQAILRDKPLFVSAGSLGQPNGTPLPAATPATLDDIQQLAAREPAVLEAIVARTISADSGVVCGPTGCTTSTGVQIPYEWFTQPSLVPGLGEVYTNWGIESLLFKTPVPVPDTTYAVVDIGAEGFQSFPYTITAPTPEAPTPVIDISAAAGLGSVFPITPAWKETPQQRFDAGVFFPETDTQPFLRDSEPQPEPVGLDGLQSPSARDAAAGFTPSALTYYTSPTTGCSAFTCTPQGVDVNVTSTTTTPLAICVVDDTATASAVLRVEDTTYDVTYPHPTAQTGLWGGVSPEQFTGTINGDWLWAGQQPVVGGTQQVRMVRYWYSETADAAPWQVLATVFQIGVDQIPPGYDPAAAQTVDAKDPDWRVCS